MRLQYTTRIWVGLAYFVILLCIALFARDIPNQYNPFDLTISKLVQVSVMGDPASFATAAIDIAENGWISSANEWILNLWPPGFVLLEAFIIKVFGIDTPIILVLQIMASALFSVVLLLLYEFLNEHINQKIALILPLLIFAFPVARVFLLEPIGISLGESFSVGFFLLAILLSIRSVVQNSFRKAIYAGIFLALSAYFRSQFEIVLIILTGWGILLFIISKIIRFQSPNIKSALKTIGVILLVAHAVTIPWRVYHWVHQGSPLWVYTVSVTFGNAVSSSEFLESVHGGFVVAGGGNLVCRINPAACGDTANAKELFIKTFLEHPLEWYSLKLGLIGKYWFSSIQNFVTVGVASTISDIVINGSLLGMLIAILYFLLNYKLKTDKLWLLLLWFNVSILSTYFIIFTIAHFEVRYFYFPKIVIITMFILLMFLHRKNKNKQYA
ncbi:hypothetical protein [Sulfuricurvum sp.]|uniref:hypothetical protein n=1 Tax=Sulfuricurvum sp. TaxID=2025608 RepID=UPI003BB2076D